MQITPESLEQCGPGAVGTSRTDGPSLSTVSSAAHSARSQVLFYGERLLPTTRQTLAASNFSKLDSPGQQGGVHSEDWEPHRAEELKC